MTIPLKFFLLALGTRGDFELFLTLGRELKGRGHHITLGTSKFFAERTYDSGIEWVQIGNSTKDDIVSVLGSLSSVQDRIKRTHLFYTRWLQPQLSMSLKRITAIGAGADYFVSNLKMILQRGDAIVPGAAVTYDPPYSIEDLPKYGTQNHKGAILELVAMNKSLLDPQDSWGEQYRFTGFWNNGLERGWSPGEELLYYLNSGAPPVVVTMGSMVMFDADRMIREICRALNLCRQRGVIVGGWSGLSANASSDPVLFVNEVPYDWLFPKASCIIHHGGCGTVAATLRAGKPSILLPQIMSQDHFSKVLIRENLATAVFDVHVLHHEDIAAAIHRAMTDEQVKKNTRKWQKTILADKGVEAAADLIESHWNQIEGLK